MIITKLNRDQRNFKFETLQLHVGQEQTDPTTDERAVPIYQTPSYVFRNCDHAAARFGCLTNPSEYVFEKRIAAIEGGVAELAVASGAAAVTYTVLNLAQNGTILFQPKIYMVVHLILLENTLLKYGIETNFVAIFNEEEIESAINEKTKALYIETLGNPNSDVVDIESITKIAHKHKIPLVVDNTFAS